MNGTLSVKQFIKKLDSNASLVWSKKYLFGKNYNNGDFITQLTSAGLICSSTLFDTIVNTETGNSDFYLVLMDSDGLSSGLASKYTGTAATFHFLINGLSVLYGPGNIWVTDSLSYSFSVQGIISGNCLCVSP
jgi:hypothetical protein